MGRTREAKGDSPGLMAKAKRVVPRDYKGP